MSWTTEDNLVWDISDVTKDMVTELKKKYDLKQIGFRSSRLRLDPLTKTRAGRFENAELLSTHRMASPHWGYDRSGCLDRTV